jgi:signal transduction histidine kinase
MSTGTELRDDAGMEGARIVVIDDDYAMRLSCRQILDKSGYAVEAYEDGAKGLEAVLHDPPDLVVVDLKMPGISGMDVLARVREFDADVIVVVITGYPTIGSAVDAIKSGAFDFLPKPFTPDELRLVVRRALGRRRLLLESHQLQLERELLRRRFVTFVSHQLKSPLAAMRQYLDVLLRLEGTEAAAEQRGAWLTRSRHRCDDLVRLVEDWLTLSWVECADLVRRREPIHLRQVLLGILDVNAPVAEARGVTLEHRLPEGDWVVVGVEVVGSEAWVSVSDTGAGIPAECQPFIFDEFFRVKDGAGGPAPSGTGLGLAICKRIATEMGGTIELESELGVGSTFKVRLPLSTPQGSDEGAAVEEGALA